MILPIKVFSEKKENSYLVQAKVGDKVVAKKESPKEISGSEIVPMVKNLLAEMKDKISSALIAEIKNRMNKIIALGKKRKEIWTGA